MVMKKAVFLDRDGVINANASRIDSPEKLQMLKGAGRAIKKLNTAGFLVVIVTNQPEIAKGFFGFDELDAVHAHMKKELAKDGARINAIYVCPHHPQKGWPGEVRKLKIDCVCRKPKPGMLLQAIKEHDIDVGQSWMIGDSKGDIAAGKAAGVKTILVTAGGGSGAKAEDELDDEADSVCRDLSEAVKYILDSI